MWFKKSVNLLQITHIFTFIFIAIAIITLQSDRYKQVAEQVAKPNYLQQEEKSLTALNLRKIIPTFGFDNLVADSIYLEFIQYFGDETARKETGYSLVSEYFTIIADRDSQFVEAYVTLSAANSMYAGKADRTVEFMNQILQKTPNQTQDLHLIWSLKAMDETIFLGDIQTARHSYQQAATSALQQYSASSNVVIFNQEKARFLATNPDPTLAQITAWNSVLPHVIKESERKIIRDRLQVLKTK
jgi:hypothetical protein